jgi:Protein of unknown function (DUF3738)
MNKIAKVSLVVFLAQFALLSVIPLMSQTAATIPENNPFGPAASVFTAVQEQLGLKLESAKSVGIIS